MEQIVSYWNIKWNDYFSQTGIMHPNVNNIQTHQFNWNAWVEWMCKMKCYENLNGEVLGIWENHWNGRLQAFYNGSITCGYEDCQAIYTDYLSQWTENLNNEVIPNMQSHNFVSSCSVQNNVYVKGSRRYELSNHLGNVLAVVSDRKIESDEDYFYAGLGSGYKFENGTYITDVDGEYRQNSGPDGIISSYSAEVISANDYYAFGSMMPGRSFSGGEYKFGFNGQERDDEVAEIGNINTAKFWEYDTRLGRRWNLDPIYTSNISRYAVNGNSPICFMDPNGDFKTWIGAFGYKILHGGTVVPAQSEAHKGEYYVTKKVDGGRGEMGSGRAKDGSVGLNEVMVVELVRWDWGKGSPANVIDGTAFAISEGVNQSIDFAKRNASDVWNSAIVRSRIPDYMVFGFGNSGAFGAYGSRDLAFTLILRGQDPGLYKSKSKGFGITSTAGVEGQMFAGYGYFYGDPRGFNHTAFEGNFVTVAAGVEAQAAIIGGISGVIDVGLDKDNQPLTITIKASINGGLGAGAPGFQFGAGFGVTDSLIKIK